MTRLVNIKVVMSLPWYNATNAVDLLTQTLTINGWSISEVQMLSRIYYPTQPIEFLVKANIETQHDQAAIVNTMRQVLNIVGSVSAVQIDSDPYANYNVINSTNPNSITGNIDIGNAAGIFGLSTGTAIVAAVVLLVVLTRK